MEQPISLELLLQQVNADDFNQDSLLLERLLDAALQYTIRRVNRTLDELNAIGEGELPAPIVQAVLMLAAYWYSTRETAATTQMRSVPLGYNSLIMSYQRLGSCGQEQ